MYIGNELNGSMMVNEFVKSVIEVANETAEKVLGDYTLMEYLTFDDVTIEPRPLMAVESRNDVNPYVQADEAVLPKKHLPIMGASMEFMRENFAVNLYNAGGLHILPRVGLTQQERLNMLQKVVDSGAKAGIAVGLKDGADFIEKIYDIDDEIPVISIDVAHGASASVLKYLLKEVFPITTGTSTYVVVGNIGSLAGYIVIDLFSYALGISNKVLAKAGVGPGAACTTRVNTGVGVGQFSLLHIIDSYRKHLKYSIEYNNDTSILSEALSKIALNVLGTESVDPENTFLRLLSYYSKTSAPYSGVNVISDGGVEKPGDFVKALAAGASYVMMGKFFVNPDFDGEFIEKDGKKYFVYYGMASKKAKNGKDEYVEGAVLTVPVKWNTTEEAVKSLEYGLRSAMTYSDAINLRTFRDLVRIVRNTPAAINEGRPRGNIIDV